MRILSWNLLKRRGATAEDIRRLVEALRPDLVLMQEVTARIDGLPEMLGGHYIRKPMPDIRGGMPGRDHGLAAWSARPFTMTTLALPVATRLDLPAGVFRVLAPRHTLIVGQDGIEVATVHLDHGQFANRRQLRHVFENRPGLNVVIGDFNWLGASRLPGFVDAGPRAATHRAYGLVGLRIDRCLVRGLRVVDAQALPQGASDHRPILVEVVRD